MTLRRRSFLAAFVAAPLVVQARSMMPIYVPKPPKIIESAWDDYEEGFWTPSFVGLDGSKRACEGSYQRIGNRVIYRVGFVYGSFVVPPGLLIMPSIITPNGMV